MRTVGSIKKTFLYALGVLLLFVIWELGALWYGKDIIIPNPRSVLAEALKIISSGSFTSVIFSTLTRGFVAFGISILLGTIIGFASYFVPELEVILHPFMTIIRATPVVALILLALIWFSSSFVPVFSAILMCFPVVSSSITTGLHATDKNLLDMTHIYHFKKTDIFLHLYLPTIKPYFAAAMHNTLGLAWKVVIAGEILSQPVFAIGTEMNNARIMLETARVFAWVICGILLCGLSDLLFFVINKGFVWNYRSKT